MESFYSYNQYLRERFGGKTYKVTLSGAFTCPTRDGVKGRGGCAFCDLRGSSSYHARQGRGKDVKTQIQSRLPGIQKRFRSEHHLAYFQSYTNTYDEVEVLNEMFTAALNEPGISGLCVGTRPDCLPDEVLDLLESLAQKHYVSLELGVQSVFDPTLEWLTRGHNAQCSFDALERLASRAPHVEVCVHLMFGSPTDPERVGRETALALNRYKMAGVKLHQLMVLENTGLADRYAKEPFKMLELDEYGEIVADFLAHLSPKFYIERLCANASHPKECIAPEWSREHWIPHNRLREILSTRNIQQGMALH